MDRYALINENNEVVNVIAWDGQAQWKVPDGHRLVPHEDVGRGDVWIEELKDFVRPLKNLKPPEDEVSIAQRKASYEAAKEIVKSSLLVINDHGKPE